VAVVTIAVEFPEEYMFGIQDGAVNNRDVGMPVGVVRKQDGTCYKRSSGGSEEKVFGKQDSAFVSKPTECLKETYLEKRFRGQDT